MVAKKTNSPAKPSLKKRTVKDLDVKARKAGAVKGGAPPLSKKPEDCRSVGCP